jgi:crotonobetainyl-CoA:carnitine CoA-transferase CaiB-like acyl-CoA transferase
VDLLEGIRVVDTSAYIFGPASAAILAHWGASVIKVESAPGGDPIRGSLDPARQSVTFHHYNRGKRGIAINLGTEAGRSLLYRLVADADVFITSQLTGTRKKLRIDVDDIRAVNPRIIYARATGQGPRGPHAERGGYDLASWWARGSLAVDAMRVSGATEPTFMVGHGDGMSGVALAGGIAAALFHRERTGVAKLVDGSLLGTALWFNAPSILSSMTGGTWPSAKVSRQERPVAMNNYKTKDGRFLQFVMLGDRDEQWADLCEHLGRPDLATDPRFATSKARTANQAAGVEILDQVFAQRTFEEWKTILSTTKAVWQPLQAPEEVHADPQTVANRFLRGIETPIGHLDVPVPPVLFDEDGGDPRRAPEFGEHTDEILAELGVGADGIADYRASGVVA